ncbi:MAG: glycosyltransferase family 2 protein [bacterium]|nr:glycosyltransferase family 2 protein [bacterium]
MLKETILPLKMSNPLTMIRELGDTPVRLDLEMLEMRFYEILPGFTSWLTLIGLGVLSFIIPMWISIFLILYDLYWLVRAVYMSSYLLSSYRQLRKQHGVDWEARLNLLDDLTSAIKTVGDKITGYENKIDIGGELPRKEIKKIKTVIWQEGHFLEDLKRIKKENVQMPDWREIINLVVIPTYKESFEVLKTTMDHLKETNFPRERLWVAMAFEERAGEHALKTKKQIEEYYGDAFGRLITTLHPDGIPGEQRVKSANATWAVKKVKEIFDKEFIAYEKVVISNFDSDTCVGREYFNYLTYAYITNADRTQCSYQPLPLYHNNIWDAPSFTRVIAINSSFWQMIEAVRPERLVTFSSHSMSFKALVDVGFWSVNVVSEDSRIFWQCFLHYGGKYRTVPLFTNVSMDATLAPTLWRTFVNQYKQKRRWAWGIENFPFLAFNFRRVKNISIRRRLKSLFLIFEGNHSWATSSIIIAVLGWIPVLYGNPEFHQTVLAYNLPYVTRALASLAMGGLIVTMTLTFLLLPPAPAGTPKRKYVYMVLQWALVPFIASILGSFPALDAQTRMMIGKPLGFWVTEKTRGKIKT